MSDTPAAWHPDPLRRHEFRYWDGATWTEHVSDKGVASTDPVDYVGPSQEAQSNGVLVNAAVRADLRGQRLVIDEQTLSWKGKSIVLADVTRLTCHVTKISAAFNYTMQYRIELWAGKQHFKVIWDGKDPQAAATYDAAISALHQTVVARLAQQEMATLVANGEAVVAKIRFTPDGIEQGKRSARWSEVTSLQPAPEARTAVVAGNRVAAVVDFQLPNAFVATALVRACMHAFGGAGRA
jgi:hypothetical protein